MSVVQIAHMSYPSEKFPEEAVEILAITLDESLDGPIELPEGDHRIRLLGRFADLCQERSGTPLRIVEDNR